MMWSADDQNYRSLTFRVSGTKAKNKVGISHILSIKIKLTIGLRNLSRLFKSELAESDPYYYAV